MSCICISGCNHNEQVYSDAVVIEISEPVNSVSAKNQPEISEMKIVELQTSDQALLSYVTRIEVADSLILIKGNNELLLFDMTGNFKTKIGRYGRGPGEYLSMSGFYFDTPQNEIVIVDGYNNRLLRHDYDGKYLSASDLPANSMNWANNVRPTHDGKLLVANQINSMDHNAYSLISGSGAGSFFPVRFTTGDYAYPFASEPIADTGTETHFILPFDNRIYEYSDAGFDTVYVINTPQPMPSENVSGRIDDYNMGSYKEVADQGLFPGFRDIFETDSILFLNYLYKGTTPAFYIIDKNAKAGTGFIYPTDFSTGTTPLLPIISRYDDYFIASAPIGTIKSIADKVPANSSVYSLLRNTADNSTDSDNGCLVFYKFKL